MTYLYVWETATHLLGWMKSVGLVVQSLHGLLGVTSDCACQTRCSYRRLVVFVPHYSGCHHQPQHTAMFSTACPSDITCARHACCICCLLASMRG
jgi:hypothetical protein